MKIATTIDKKGFFKQFKLHPAFLSTTAKHPCKIYHSRFSSFTRWKKKRWEKNHEKSFCCFSQGFLVRLERKRDENVCSAIGGIRLMVLLVMRVDNATAPNQLAKWMLQHLLIAPKCYEDPNYLENYMNVWGMGKPKLTERKKKESWMNAFSTLLCTFSTIISRLIHTIVLFMSQSHFWWILSTPFCETLAMLYRRSERSHRCKIGKT